MAAWSGTATIGAISGTSAASNVCQTTWIVTTQADKDLGGTFQLTGGSSVPCGQSGPFTGTVTPAGAVTMAFAPKAPPAGCTILSGTDLVGLVSGVTMTLQQTVHLSCLGSPVDQTVTLALTRR